MWEAVHENIVESWFDDNISPPFFDINSEHLEWNEVDPNRVQDEILFLDFQPSGQSDPLDLGQYIDKVATLYIPSMRTPRVQGKEATNLQAIISTPITCTLSLIELMKVKP